MTGFCRERAEGRPRQLGAEVWARVEVCASLLCLKQVVHCCVTEVDHEDLLRPVPFKGYPIFPRGSQFKTLEQVSDVVRFKFKRPL